MQQAFADEIVRLISELRIKQYPLRGLLSRCKRRIRCTPVLYGVARGISAAKTSAHRTRGLYNTICQRLGVSQPP